MWATVGAALKKIAVALLGNPKVLKTIGGIVPYYHHRDAGGGHCLHL